MGSHNMESWGPDDNVTRPYVPASPQMHSDMLITSLLANAEQALAFASAHLDQIKAHVAQLRSVIGQ